MAITKKHKQHLIESYTQALEKAKNVVILNQFALPVNVSNAVRQEVTEHGGQMIVARKRLLLLSLNKVGFEEVAHKDLNGSVVLLLSNEDEFAPLKAVNKAVKGRKKSQAKRTYEYVGGWYEKNWKSGEYVNELANLPTKEELIGKLLFLLKHPIQKFVGTVDAIAKKKSEE